MRIERRHGDLADIIIDTYDDLLNIRAIPEYRFIGLRTAQINARQLSDIGLAEESVADTFGEIADYLFDYQRWVVELALDRKRFAVFADTGLGKTAMQLEWARLVQNAHGGRTLVVAPLNVVGQTLAESVHFYGDSLPIDDLRGRDAFTEWLNNGNGIGITNYEKIDGTDRSIAVDAVVLDESSVLKASMGARRTAIMAAFRGVPYKLCCSATPAPNDRMEYGEHAFFLDVVRSTREFLAAFFVNRDGNWELKRHGEKKFYEHLASWSVFMRDPKAYGFADHLSDLPPLQTTFPRVDLTIEQVEAAREHEHGNQPSLLGAVVGGVTSRTKVMQIAHGFQLSDGKVVARYPTNKPAAIAELVNVTHGGEPVIVWVTFDEEGDQLARLIPGAAHLSGRTPMAQRNATIEAFASHATEEPRVVILKSSMFGYGLNLQSCRVQVFSTITDSFERFYQSVRRSHRYGQVRPVHVYVPLTDLDEAICQNVLSKESTFLADAQRQQQAYVDVLRPDDTTEKRKLMTIPQAEIGRASSDNWTLVHGDSIAHMPTMEAHSMDLAVFSPPFANLFTYSSAAADMGNVRQDDEYRLQWDFFATELARIMKPGRVVAIHCFPAGTLVGSSVPARIEDVKEVFGHDGLRHKVTEHIAHEFTGELHVIKATGCLPIRCTDEHPIQVVRPYRRVGGRTVKPNWRDPEPGIVAHYNAQPEWVRARDIQPGDFLVGVPDRQPPEPVIQSWCRFSDHPNAINPRPLNPDSDTAWMLGLFAADGGTMGRSGIVFTLSPRDDAARLVRVWQELGLVARVADHQTYKRVVVTSRTVADSFREWFGKSDEKHLPAFLFDGWPLHAVLEGLVDGDGTRLRGRLEGRIRYDTISPILARQVHQLLLNIGESPVITEKKPHTNTYPNAKPSFVIEWTPLGTHHMTTWWRGLYLMPVRTITREEYAGTVHNLEVADAESYTVGGVVVHNCMDVIRFAGQHGTRHTYDYPADLRRGMEDVGFTYHARVAIDKNPQIQATRTKDQNLLFVTLTRDALNSHPQASECVLVFRAPGDSEVPVKATDISNQEWIRWAHHVWYDIRETDVLNAALAKEQEDERHICLASGSLVLTRDGYVPIEDVEVGDLVVTHEGRWMPVTAKRCNGVAEIVRTEAQGVADLRTTPDHRMWTRVGHGLDAKRQAVKSNPEWVEAADTPGSYLNLKLPPVEASSLSEGEWWIVGRWLGDGHRNTQRVGHGDAGYSISCAHEELPDLLERLGEHAGHVARRTASQVALRGLSQPMRRLLARCGKGAAGKRVPGEAICLEPLLAESLLAGYLSADGHYVTKCDRWTASSVSRPLLLGMALVAQRARGVVASVYAGRPPGKTTIDGRVVATKQDWILAFRNTLGYRQSGWVGADGAWKKVRKVTPTDSAVVWDLQVEGDASFTAEGAIVHNCPLQLGLIERCVRLWSNPGETVFSPFAGIGSEGWESLAHGRRFYGVELKEAYWRTACEFLTQREAMNGERLFDIHTAVPVS